MSAGGPDLFGNVCDPQEARLADFHFALVSRPADDEAVLRRADWVADVIGPPPPGLGSYDLAAYRELVAAYVSGRSMSCILLASSVIDRHLTLLHRLRGARWRGTLEEKIERLRGLDTPVEFLRPRMLGVVAATRALGGDPSATPPARGDASALEAWENELAAQAKNALAVAIFIMTRLPAHLCRPTKGTE